MFFALSKLLAFLLKPLNWIVVLGLIAVLSKQEHRRRKAAQLCVGLLLFFTNPLIVNLIIGKIEAGVRRSEPLVGSYDVGILLGGCLHPVVEPPPGIQQFGLRANRMTETVALLHSGKIRHILLSGGDGRLVGSREPEAQTLRTYLLRAGVPDSAIWVEDRSRNTRENAVFSKELLDRRTPGASCLLITSALHLGRAEACFQKIGLKTASYSADFQAEPLNIPLRWVQPSWEAVGKWEQLIKEAIGWLAYSIKGYV